MTAYFEAQPDAPEGTAKLARWLNGFIDRRPDVKEALERAIKTAVFAALIESGGPAAPQSLAQPVDLDDWLDDTQGAPP